MTLTGRSDPVAATRRWVFGASTLAAFLTSGLSVVAAAAAGIAGARVLMHSGFGLALLSFLVAAVLLAIHFRPAASRASIDRLFPPGSPR